MSLMHSQTEPHRGRSAYIETSNRSEGGVVAAPVRHNVALESELALENLIQGAIVLTSPGGVHLV